LAKIGKYLRFPFFLSSYSPLWLIFLTSYLIQKFELLQKSYIDKDLVELLEILFSVNDTWIVLGISISLIFIPLVVLKLYIKRCIDKNPPREFVVKTRQNITNEYILYVVTYIFPFISDKILDLSNIFSLLILILTLGILYIGANLYYVNPTLSVLGFKLYRITDKFGNDIILLSKKSSIPENTTIKINDFSENVYIHI
jgi:hypothetical protein